jgi:hypothetical protein
MYFVWESHRKRVLGCGYWGGIVNENRLMTFLIQEVVIMPTAKRGRKTLAQKNNEELARSQTIVDLWEKVYKVYKFLAETI